MTRGRALVAILVIAVLVVLIPAPSSAAVVTTTSAVAAADTVPNFDPSSGKWRRWMINVLSSVLGAATPNKWRAEQIANAYYYDHGFETLNQKFGIDAVRTNSAGQMTGVRWIDKGSGTYTDVVIAGLEDSYKGKAAAGKGPVRAPATPIKNMVKVVGGVGSAVFAYEMGALLGGAGTNLVGSWLGFDANGTVCGAQGFDNDVQRWIFRSMAGQDCSLWDYEHTFVPDPDMGMTLGPITVRQYVDTSGPATAYCDLTAAVAGQVYQIKYSDTVSYTSIVAQSSHSAFNAMRGACGSPTNVAIKVVGKYNPHTVDNVRRVLNGTPVETILPTFTEIEKESGCKVTYTDSTSLTNWSEPYLSSAGVQQPQCPETPAGKTPDDVEFIEQNVDGTSPETLLEEPVTDEFKEWWEQYPECQWGACELDLIRKSPLPVSSCFDLDAGCPDWHTDPDKTSNYVCRYGVHDVDLEECNVYAGIFQPGRVTTGSPYSDPSSGEWSGGQNAPLQRNSNMQRVLQDPTNLRSCDFADVGFDPVGWILRGGQCLAEWTFVARPAVVDVQTAALEETWAGSLPGQLSTSIAAVEPALAGLGSGNCGGVIVPVPVPGAGTSPVIENHALLPACPGDFFAPFAPGFYWFLLIGFVFAGLFGVKRQLDNFVGNS